MQAKLKVNDVIQINGHILLKGISGKLRISKIDNISYWLTKVNGKKYIRHYIHNVDAYLNKAISDINYIEIIH
jgi:hypothetical protein